MAQSFDLHVHTSWSDGKSSAEDVILAAISAGLDTVGISDHSYTVYDEPGCTLPESASAYRADIRSLAEKYKDKIRVLCGVEQDSRIISAATGTRSRTRIMSASGTSSTSRAPGSSVTLTL